MGRHSFKRNLSRVFCSLALAGAGLWAGVPAQAQETRYSRLLDEIEAEGNAATASAKKIVILDSDEALLDSLSGSAAWPGAQLQARGLPADRSTQSSIRLAMSHDDYFHPLQQNPQAFPYAVNGQAACAIVPDTLDLSGRTRARSFWGASVRSDMAAQTAPEGFFRHVTYHELWHCLDTTFLPAAEAAYKTREADPAAYAVLLHRREMFAEIGATLTLAAKGETDISRIRADLRAWKAYTSGWTFIRGFEGETGYSPKYDPEYYSGAFYYLTPGTDAALEHVRQAGPAAVSAYTFADIGRIAAELTEKHALDRAQIVAMANYFRDGEAYLGKLRASGAAASKKELAFLQSFIARAKAAGERTAIPANDGFRTPPFHSALPDEEFAKAFPPAARAAVEKDLRGIFARAAAPDERKAAAELLDRYRHALHHAAPDDGARRDYEDRLAVLRLMMGKGQVRKGP